MRWKIAQFFEWLWWRFYLFGKKEESYLAWKKDYWKKFLEKASIQVKPDDEILEAGCGPAGIFMMFPENQVTALDPLLGKYRNLFRHLQDGNSPNVCFIETAFEKYQPEKTFGKVFCLNAINHVADLDVCLEKLHYSLKEGGVLVLSVDAHRWLFFKKLFKLIPGDMLHPHQYSLSEYEQKLENTGFYIIEAAILKREFFFDYHLIIATK